MEVENGYKQTEVGVIPQDWMPTPISKLASIRGRVGWKGYTKKDLVELGPLTIGATQISKNNRLELSDPTFLSKEKYLESPEIMVSFKDILIVQRGSTIGKVVLIDQHIGEATINPSRVIIRTHTVSPDFVFYYLLSTGGQQQIFADVSSTGVPMISQRQIGNFCVSLPPTIAEQAAIAEALSDADALIEALEQLLAKKRQIKQGVMQELLTGKRRLPGLSGEWEVKRVGEVLTLRYGKSQQGIVANGGKFPIIATSGEVGRTNQYLYDKPSVIIGRKGTIDAPQYIDTPFWTIDTAYYSEISQQGNPKFLFYLLTTIDWYSYNEASGVPSLNAKTVENIEISLPKLPEQTAIAEILSDMDAEIATLEEKLSKARQVKQGMMSELLTGRVRLV